MGDLWPRLSYLPLHAAPSLYFFFLAFTALTLTIKTPLLIVLHHCHTCACLWPQTAFSQSICAQTVILLFTLYLLFVPRRSLLWLFSCFVCPRRHKEGGGGGWPLYSSSQYQDSNSASIFHGLTESKSRAHPLTVP